MPKNFYPRRTEPSMRDEMINTLQGKFPEISKKMPVLLRKMRRDDTGLLVPCECVDLTTNEPDKDTFCPICHGEGHKWDEVLMETYRVLIRSDVGNATREELFEAGLTNISTTLFYTDYNEPVTEDDKIVELILDFEGTVVTPAKRLRLHRIVTVTDFRADYGRLEYLKIGCFEEKRKWLNG